MNGIMKSRCFRWRFPAFFLWTLALVLIVVACDRRPPVRVDTASPDATDTLTILHTNDMHASLLPDAEGRGGWATLAAMIKDIRQGRDDVLVLDAGDMTQGSPVSTFFKGVPIFVIMNAMGYDAAALGNHEFDNGAALIAQYRQVARFPLLSANVFLDGALVADAAEMMIDVDGVKVALLSLTTPTFVKNSPALQGSGLEVADPIQTAREAVARLDPQVDLIVALTHLGIDEDRELARQIGGIDLIIGGHSHTLLKGPVTEGDTLIVQAGSKGQHLGRVDLTVDLQQGRIARFDVKNLRVNGAAAAADPATLAVIDEWEGKVRDQVDVLIGYSPRNVGVEELRGHISRIWRDAYGGDFGLQNKGGTRDGLSRGEIHIRDIYNALPFDDTIYILELDSGQISVVIDAPVFREAKPLYTLVTNNYVGEKLIRRFDLPAERVRRTGKSWRESIIRAIREMDGLEAPLARTGTAD